MRIWLFGLVLGVVLTAVATEISLIAMIAAVVVIIFLGLIVPPRYAFLSGGFIGIGGLWLAAIVPTLNCQLGTAACGNPYPLTGLASVLVIFGVIAGLATTRRRYAKGSSDRGARSLSISEPQLFGGCIRLR